MVLKKLKPNEKVELIPPIYNNMLNATSNELDVDIVDVDNELDVDF